MAVRRVVMPLVLVLALLAGGSVASSCTTSPSGEIVVDQEALYASGTAISLILLGILARAGNPYYVPQCKYCLGIL